MMKKRLIHRHSIPRQANILFAFLFLLGSVLLAALEVGTNKIGILFLLNLFQPLVAQGDYAQHQFWGDMISWGGGSIPLVFLVFLYFKHSSGHYERKQDIHTEKLDQFDRSYTPESIANVILHVLGIGIPVLLTLYGMTMDWVGVYGFLGHPSFTGNRTLFLIAAALGIIVALISTWGVPNLFFTAWDMLDEAKIQKRRHTIDFQKQTQVPEEPGLITRIASIGGGKQIAPPRGRNSHTTTI